MAFVDENGLHWCLDARNGHFKSISLFKAIGPFHSIGLFSSIGFGERIALIGNACGDLGNGPGRHYCTPRWSFEFHCRKHAHTQWDEEAQQHHSQHDVPPP
jgi:hypothetical protein